MQGNRARRSARGIREYPLPYNHVDRPDASATLEGWPCTSNTGKPQPSGVASTAPYMRFKVSGDVVPSLLEHDIWALGAS